MKYLSSLPIALLVAALPLAATAETLRDGLHAVVTDGGRGSLRISGGHAELAIAGERCFGGTEGPVSEVVDRMATFTNRQDGQSCTITLGIGDDGEPATLEEGSGCGYFHGASCGFSGRVTGREVPASIEAIDAGFNALSREARMEAQEALRARGTYTGAIDGATGPGTRRAVIDAARADLAGTPDLNLESAENVQTWLLSLTGPAASQAVQAPEAAPEPTNKPAVDAGNAQVRPEATTAESAEVSGPAWIGEWHCETDVFDRPAHFTFTESDATIHNIGATMNHDGAQPIGGREDALLIDFADGERLGLFSVQPDSMIIWASSGIFDCAR